jgi:hypothetical protein
LTLAASAQQAPASKEEASRDAMQHSSHHDESSGGMVPHPSHSAGAAISYADLKNTVTQLERARQATAKYQDVHVAEADGYRAMGPEFPGTGLHFVLTLEPKEFDIEKPPILLYEKSPAASGGYSLVGVVYLWKAAEGSDGQPLDPPFPKLLAHWHRHTNICALPGIANPHGLTEQQCREQGGHFVADVAWMVHAWIWKDNPAGVFSDANPSVR